MAVMTDEQAGGGWETRWSANKKTDALLRLLRGERLDEVSRELRVEAHRRGPGAMSSWPPARWG